MPRLTSVLTLRGRSLLTAGLTLVACGTLLGFIDLTRIGVLAIALPVIVAFRARRHALRLVVDRQVTPHRVQIGQSAEVQLTVENRDRQSTPLLLAEECLDLSLGERPRFILPRLGRGERRELTYRVRSSLRGRHELGPLKLQVTDPFDLAVRSVVLPTSAEVIVLPRVYPLSTATPLASGAGGEGAIPQHVALHGEDDIAIREYRHGDDLRRIHWPSTARTGEVMMRQEDRPARRRAVVLVDTRACAHGITGGAGTSESLEWAISAAASVVAHLARQQFSVHLLTPATVTDHAVHSGLAVGDALDVLAMAEASAQRDITDLVLAGEALTSGGGLLVAIVGEVDSEGAQALSALRRPGVQALALVLSGAAWSDRRTVRGAEQTVTARVLATHGWSVSPVGARTEVVGAWADLDRQRSVVLR